ncbi:MAG: hypothetical protein ACOCRZ_01685 [Halothermotrichaceae bacterium]
MAKKKKNKLVHFINYKDIIIILGSWFFIKTLISLSCQLGFNHPLFTDIVHYLFVISGRFLFFALLIFYLSYLYPLSFKNLGLAFNRFRSQLFAGIYYTLFLLLIVLLLINVPLTFKENLQVASFTPFYRINSPEVFIGSLIPFIITLPFNFIIALSELFVLIILVYELFNYTLFTRFVSAILASLFYSIILYEFNPGMILLNLLMGIISITLYRKYKSLIAPAIFTAGYYSIYIFYIYGWSFIK